ncbi:hypothetical protein H310_06551 [Aphanomyces invadans]|uniref:Uncharacterized protein n=1 Tax=Aphanomyces invadans TaxID=157072 RepID=A0A024U6Z4_9STRA|nr:hypothetical protein H310_06551 [Aphanomyces invadans]ETW02039.1 hypothetical protein H310_06551 [Aphanomyces invadans]|eukprot:XP_008869887.1 hypothetical protein H310_06551 [Aphanomyces invadans]
MGSQSQSQGTTAEAGVESSLVEFNIPDVSPTELKAIIWKRVKKHLTSMSYQWQESGSEYCTYDSSTSNFSGTSDVDD